MPRTAVCLILSILFGVGASGSISNIMKPQIKIHRTDMSEELQQDTLQIAFLASNLYEVHNDIARYIATEFEKRQGGYWNCIVGDCGFYVRNELNSYINFSFGDTIITVFRSP